MEQKFFPFVPRSKHAYTAGAEAASSKISQNTPKIEKQISWSPLLSRQLTLLSPPAFLLLLRENKKRDLEVSDLFFSDELLPILDKNDKCGFNDLESISVLFA